MCFVRGAGENRMDWGGHAMFVITENRANMLETCGKSQTGEMEREFQFKSETVIQDCNRRSTWLFSPYFGSRVTRGSDACLKYFACPAGV